MKLLGVVQSNCSSNGFVLYLMCCGVMLLFLIIYIYMCMHIIQ